MEVLECLFDVCNCPCTLTELRSIEGGLDDVPKQTGRSIATNLQEGFCLEAILFPTLLVVAI